MITWKNYNLVTGSALVAVLAVIVALNVFVDPYAVFGIFEFEALKPYSSGQLSRVAKAEIAQRDSFSAVLIGDSRVLIGLDPKHPGLARYQTAYNLALKGCSVYEATRLVSLAQNTEAPELVIWGLDPEFLWELPLQRLKPAARESKLNPELSRRSYLRQHLIGIEDTYDSLACLQRYLLTPETRLHSHGKKVRHPPVMTTDSLIVDLCNGTSRVHVEPGPEPIRLLKESLERLLQQRTRVIFFFPPMHAMRHELYARFPERQRLARAYTIDLVEAAEQLHKQYPEAPPIEVWDFRGFTEFHCEEFPLSGTPQRMQWHRETLHMSPELGDLVLNRILSGSEGDPKFGVPLNSKTLDDHLRSLEDDREQYRKRHPDQLKFVDAAERRIQ